MLKLYDLTIEYKHEPLGLDEVQPRFSWKLESDKQDTVQAAYRLALNCGGKTVWDSDRGRERAEYSERVSRSKSDTAHRVHMDRHRVGQPRRNRRSRKPL